MSVDIIIDDREQAIIPLFNSFTNPSANYKVSRINYGDYAVMYKNHTLMLIERKTWKDMSSSIKDGRKHNVEKLKKIRTKTNCKLFYLIEGNPIPKSTTRFARIPCKNLRAHLDHLMIRDNIHIIHSKNKKNTVYRIFEIVRNYLSITPSPLLKYDAMDGGGGISQLKEKIVCEKADTYKLWCAIPNITEKTASLFINKGYHISDLLLKKISKEQIFELKYANNYVIGKRSEKIWKSISSNEVHIKILSQIKGVTKKTAEIILNTYKFESLMNGETSIEMLSIIQKTSSKKLGIVVASRIINKLTKKP